MYLKSIYSYVYMPLNNVSLRLYNFQAFCHTLIVIFDICMYVCAEMTNVNICMKDMRTGVMRRPISPVFGSLKILKLVILI